MESLNEKFTFWCPLEKSEQIVDPTTGEKTMRLGGIASTSDEDSDGEFLDPKGFDIKPLMKSGLVNWHHQAKGQPSAIIGEPSKGEIRKEGLYLEVDLYPSSKVAHEVFELAEILERDSSTRRLGFSIEGKVLKRKSNDKSNPDYNHIEKAVITGVAVTHMPKNPKTFANIIKGEIDNEFEKEEEENDNQEKKALTADGNGKPLKKESVDSKLKVTTFKKAQVMDRIFKDCAGITVSKAEKIFALINKISNMKGKKNITEEDIEKAYETLGLDIEKGDGCADGGCTKKIEKSADEEDKTKKKKVETPDPDNADDDDDSDEDDDDAEKACKKGEDSDDDDDEDKNDDEAEKGGNGGNRFDVLEKAISDLGTNNFNCMRALGVMLKGATNELKSSKAQIDELNEIVKAQKEEISELRDLVEAFGDSTPAPKSLSHAHVVERRFNKGNQDELEKANQQDPNAVSMSRNRSVVAELLDQATFAKGFDEEFSKACTTFEAAHTLPKNIIERMKKEFNVTIVD